MAFARAINTSVWQWNGTAPSLAFSSEIDATAVTLRPMIIIDAPFYPITSFVFGTWGGGGPASYPIGE